MANHESVYGGSMNQQEFFAAEFEVADEMPEWILPDVKGIEATIMGEKIILSRTNTMIFDFDWIDVDGFKMNFDHMSHIYIHRGDGKQPFWHMKPEDEKGQNEWNKFANMLVNIDCTYYSGIPRELDFEQYGTFMRGDEPIEDIIKRILDE